MAITEGQRLLAEGKPITLADGTQARIILSARAFALIEDRYGSIGAYIDALTQTLRGKLMGQLAFTFHIALGMDEEAALDLIDTRQINEYLVAINEALNEALPAPEEGERGNSKATPGRSRGVAGITRRSSVGVSPPIASGV